MSIDVAGFALDIRHWRTAAAFRAHLAAHDPGIAGWARAVIVHHTVKPVPRDWLGHASMIALARYYRGLGWDAGPHLFVVAGAPDVRNDGIWQLTPLDRPGVHAQAANAFAWGIEHVGNFDAAPMPPDVAALGAAAAAALLDWRGLAADNETVQPHRRYSTKTCPGTAVDMVAYVRAVRALQAPPDAPPTPPQPRYDALSPILSAPGLERAALARAVRSRCVVSPYSSDAIIAAATCAYDLAVAVGVDPVVVAAQMCHETGNLTSAWCRPPHHNPAGIGITGQPNAGVTFPDLCTGIDAQVGRLLAYATLPAERSEAQYEAVHRALAWRTLPAACHGSAITLRALGRVHNLQPSCGWASPGTNYGDALAAVANRLVELSRL